MSSTHEPQRKVLKEGDRIWIWPATPPSEFEKQIARQLSDFDKECSMFFVEVFSWRSTPIPNTKELIEQLPKAIEVAQDRCIGLHAVGKETSIELLVPTLMYDDLAAAGDIRYNSRIVAFSNKLLIVVGCRQADRDRGHSSLKGSSDVIGLLSLQFGRRISQRPIASDYFNIRECKFVNASLTATKSVAVEEYTFGLKGFYNLDQFDGDDDVVHSALWFAGKAFTETDAASKIVFFHTAMDVLSSQNIKNHYQNLYKRGAHAKRALETIDRFNKLRRDVVHYGIIEELPSSLERHIQLLLLDAIVARQTGSISESAFAAALDA